MSIKKKFGKIISFLVASENKAGPITGIEASRLFKPDETDDISMARNMVGCFLVLLCGPSAPRHEEAANFLQGRTRGSMDKAASFFVSLAGYVHQEVEARYEQDADFRNSLDDLHAYISTWPEFSGTGVIKNKLWSVFFPEGVTGAGIQDRIAMLREKRRVRISALNSAPIKSPGSEVLFTANVLLTVPSPLKEIKGQGLDADARRALEDSTAETQLYWYDHPIPIGAGLEQNELVYGIRNLSDALRFEERLGTKDPGRDIDCVLSVSVTHAGLHRFARTWLESELARARGIRGIRLYLFTEDEAAGLLEHVLVPAAQRYMPGCDIGALMEIFGIDGEYGRHYSFLKAIARFWNVMVSPEVRATFKMDLDQVFPQEELVKQTGASAFQHLCTPLWGAQGIDSNEDRVYMGMLAGALVKRKDIASSLFTPDVPLPERGPQGDEWIFWSAVPQAISTEAEMTAVYGAGQAMDGRSACIQRVHVTGGMNGILVEALKRYRPFTPSWFGRAEDQAYLLSVLRKQGGQGFLRYAHEYGLTMRHDTEAFARDAFEQGRNGKMIGDYIRMLLFSGYAHALPWPVDAIKDAIDPFTGCFISRIPVTVACLRFVLKAAQLLSSSKPEEGLCFFTDGVKRLSGAFESQVTRKDRFQERYEREKRGWDLYYDVLDVIEQKISERDPFALELMRKAREHVNNLRIKI